MKNFIKDSYEIACDMNGILIVDKPGGITSHDAVSFIRKTFGIKKVGHAGTLDPMATGVLVILLGKSTKESNQISNYDKSYLGRMTLGARSDTGDKDGKITATDAAINFSKAEIERVFTQFTGEISQVPPMYSAIKFKGAKMYEFARRGVEIPRRPRRVAIRSLFLRNFQVPFVDFEVVCSKGTYVRQLCADMGQRLGCGAYLESLRRTSCGGYSLEDAIPLERLKGMPVEELETLLRKI